jgi:hypothetical protein
MATCEHCGNDYAKAFHVRMSGDGQEHTFDSIECMAQAVGPRCEHCGCTILGHGIESDDGRMFCCAHCARAMGVQEAVDHVTAGAGSAPPGRPASDS